MSSVRLNVVAHGKGYIAESPSPHVSALGSSAEEAAENGRLMLIAFFVKGARPSTLIVRSTEPGRCKIVTQPLDKPVSFAVLAKESAASGKRPLPPNPPPLPLEHDEQELAERWDRGEIKTYQIVNGKEVEIDF